MRTRGPELTNVRAARIVALRRLAKRTFRARGQQFLAEGPQAVREALHVPGIVTELFVTAPGVERYRELVHRADETGVPVQLVSGEVFAAIAQTVTPQGIVAVCRFVDVPFADVQLPDPTLVAVLAHVRDPGNAGTLIRCADAAGAAAVVVTDASVDIYNPKCVRATAGSVFHLPIVVGVRTESAVAELKERGVTVLAADGAGSMDLDTATAEGLLSGPTAWIFGNEAWGLPAQTSGLADAVVRVPVYGRAESLNLATAAAVCLYASARSQRVGSG